MSHSFFVTHRAKRVKVSAMNKASLEKISTNLSVWYTKSSRDLPWRKSKNPYFVWISEIMLQQTTTKAVRPYFSEFTKTWPTLNKLSKASVPEIYEKWQGLGYYSRARNILKASQILVSDYKGQIPTTWEELIKLPGIGPYTSRAVSSICFDEPVGVVDGNVLRVHNRLLGKKINWWEKDFFNKTQKFSDALVKFHKPSVINQALMDLGATVCTPKNPTCIICPVRKSCASFKKGLQNELPLPKPKKQSEHWVYEVSKQSSAITSNKKILAANLSQAPVLKGKLLPFGKFKKLEAKPAKYDFMHSITHHKIYIQFKNKKISSKTLKPLLIGDLRRENPSSLVEKIWQHPSFVRD